MQDLTMASSTHKVILLSAILLCHLVQLVLCSQDLSEHANCSPWFQYDSSKGKCVCSDEGRGRVVCTDEGALLRFGSCMTHIDNRTVVGRCEYFMLDPAEQNVTQYQYITLPQSLSELNDYVCGPMNRKGVICSECIEGYGPSLTSVGEPCVNCAGAWYGIPLFLFLEFAPITLFYLFILFFRISFTSAPMTAFLLFSQLTVYTITGLDSRTRNFMKFTSPSGYQAFVSVASVYSLFNLDFFRYAVPPFCISDKLKIIHLLLFAYLSAYYPLLLIGLTYLCTKVFYWNIKPIFYIRIKILKYFLRSKRVLKIDNTLVDVFASFLLLSYTKFMLLLSSFVSFTQLRQNNDTRSVLSSRLGGDPRVVYFSGEHIPYFLFSLLSFIVPVVLSTLLLTLYPIKIFRKVLFEKCHTFSSEPKGALNIFVKRFHRSYRDGLDGGKDLRSFAGLYVFLRATIFIIVGLIPGHGYGSLLWIVLSLVFIATGVLIIMVKPYKKAYANVIDTLIMLNLSLISAMFSLYHTSSKFPNSVPFSPTFILWIINIGGVIPFVGLVIYVVVRIVHRSKRASLWNKIKEFCKGIMIRRSKQDLGSSANQRPANYDDNELPDRFLHPEDYDNTRHTQYVSVLTN